MAKRKVTELRLLPADHPIYRQGFGLVLPLKSLLSSETPPPATDGSETPKTTPPSTTPSTAPKTTSE